MDHELILVEADPAQAGAPDGEPHWACVCGNWRWTLHPDGGPSRDDVTDYHAEHLL